MRAICSERRGAGEHHLHLLLHSLVKYPTHKPQPTAARGLDCSKPALNPQRSLTLKRRKGLHSSSSLQGRQHFAGARLWVMFLETGSQNSWGVPMCLITELRLVGNQDFSASLPSSVLLTTRCPKLSVTPQQTRSPALSIRTLLNCSLLRPFVICLSWAWGNGFQPVIYRFLGA